MITRKEEYLWNRFSEEKKKEQIIRKIIVVIAVAAVLSVIVALSMEVFASEETKEETVKIELIAEELEIITEEKEMAEEPELVEDKELMLDEEESYLLAKIAMAEAEGESVEGKAWVIMVVLNRVWAADFPDTIEEVILQHNENTGVYQFAPAMPGGRWWIVEPDEECWEALELIRSYGWDESEGAL